MQAVSGSRRPRQIGLLMLTGRVSRATSSTRRADARVRRRDWPSRSRSSYGFVRSCARALPLGPSRRARLARERNAPASVRASVSDAIRHAHIEHTHAAGAEEVFVRAERDLRENVQNDRITDVGRDRHTRVARDDHASIEGLRVTRVQGDDILAVQGNLSVNVHGGCTWFLDVLGPPRSMLHIAL